MKIENTEIYNADCFDIFPSIPDKSVDMVLCDLPYGVTQNSWDKVLPFDKLWAAYKRVTKVNAAIVLFAQMPFTVDLVNSNRKMFRYEWIWQKTKTVGYFNANRIPLRVHEQILVFYDKLPTYNPQWWYDKPYKKNTAVPLII